MVAQRATRAWLSTDTGTGGGGMFDKLAFIGTGKMAQAMMLPLIKHGYQPENKIAIYDVSTLATKSIKKKFPDMQIANSIEELVIDADMIICAVKPQNINAKFWSQFPEKMRDDATFVSILAGTPIKDFEPSGCKKIVRAMPNTPATIGQGMTVWCCTPSLTPTERDSVKEVLCQFGKTVGAIKSFLVLP
jgi:pyrroline-5-carboxylate reductase